MRRKQEEPTSIGRTPPTGHGPLPIIAGYPLVINPYSGPEKEWFDNTIKQLMVEYDVGEDSEKPHYQILIQRVASSYVDLVLRDSLDDRGSREYEAMSRALIMATDRLMRYTEQLKIQAKYAEAKRAQEKLTDIIRNELCPECLKKIAVMMSR
jgi:hypothetical protein